MNQEQIRVSRTVLNQLKELITNTTFLTINNDAITFNYNIDDSMIIVSEIFNPIITNQARLEAKGKRRGYLSDNENIDLLKLNEMVTLINKYNLN